jgi:CubicO group peptidase (beta-lactamase class C family)
MSVPPVVCFRVATESLVPDKPGRWLAWIEGTAPNGTPLRRSLTFYALPKQLPSSYVSDLTVASPNLPGRSAPAVVQDHEAEISRLANKILLPTLMDNGQGAVVIAGLALVTLVARRGVIVTHEAFGCDAKGKPISRDYRCWAASITKTVTALLFSQVLDQGLIELDDPLSVVFPDYPKDDSCVPTF